MQSALKEHVQLYLQITIGVNVWKKCLTFFYITVTVKAQSNY